MEQEEYRKLLPLVNPKLYKSNLNKERLLKLEEQRESQQADSTETKSSSEHHTKSYNRNADTNKHCPS